jgi:hypothetical protein
VHHTTKKVAKVLHHKAIKVAKKPILTKVVKKVVFPKLPAVKVVTHKTIVHKPIHKLPAVKPIHKTTIVHKVVTHKKPLIVKPHTATKKITITHHKTATHPKLVVKVPVVHHTQHPAPAAKPETHLGVIFRTIMHAVKGTLHKVTTPITTMLTKATTLTTRTTMKIVTPIHTKVVHITKPVVTKITSLLKPITVRVAKFKTCPFVDCWALKTWTARMKCLWRTECNIIHKIIGHVTLL